MGHVFNQKHHIIAHKSCHRIPSEPQYSSQEWRTFNYLPRPFITTVNVYDNPISLTCKTASNFLPLSLTMAFDSIPYAPYLILIFVLLYLFLSFCPPLNSKAKADLVHIGGPESSLGYGILKCPLHSTLFQRQWQVLILKRFSGFHRNIQRSSHYSNEAVSRILSRIQRGRLTQSAVVPNTVVLLAIISLPIVTYAQESGQSGHIPSASSTYGELGFIIALAGCIAGTTIAYGVTTLKDTLGSELRFNSNRLWRWTLVVITLEVFVALMSSTWNDLVGFVFNHSLKTIL